MYQVGHLYQYIAYCEIHCKKYFQRELDCKENWIQLQYITLQKLNQNNEN